MEELAFKRGDELPPQTTDRSQLHQAWLSMGRSKDGGVKRELEWSRILPGGGGTGDGSCFQL